MKHHQLPWLHPGHKFVKSLIQCSYVYIVKYAEQEAFQNDRVETTNSKYRLAFNILISGGKKRS